MSDIWPGLWAHFDDSRNTNYKEQLGLQPAQSARTYSKAERSCWLWELVRCPKEVEHLES